ncbi:hypothetical protein C7377_0042 [Balneicella halophila]|uniref:Uncharacterized protein n=1 Tax=Balneicella halophila TaxID=1537566 RepID=A0A7L4URA0_BALHA|nr:hypothetical protein [Balneicella halophila]PVX51757.1 hypothetical protein C7377_0042 [Balneicella halophila]
MLIAIVLALIIIVATVWGLIKLVKWIALRINSTLHENSQRTIEVSFPNPEKVNDFRFYEYIEEEVPYKLEPIYAEMKKKGLNIKPEFKRAIASKIRNGTFKNPLNFKEYFGTNFDFIGINFLRGTDDLFSTFQIELCFIQYGKLASIKTYDFMPPDEIFENRLFQENVELLGYRKEWIEDNYFKDIWHIFDLRDFLNSNLLILWDDGVETLKKVLDKNQITDYNISTIKIREVAQANHLPDSIDSLLNHFHSDLTIENDELSMIVCELAMEFTMNGIDLENYVKTMNSNNN